jgi:V/A-type H+-transporting ATPase subunit K
MEAITIEAFLPAGIVIAASVLAGAWCLSQGSTISASASVEKGGSSPWGVSLSLFGALIIVYGFFAGLMLMVNQVPSLMTLLGGILLIFGLVLVVSVTKTRGDEKSISTALEGLSSWGVITGIVVVLGVVFIIISGGEGGELIPETAWPLLMGAITMIGAGFAAAICIVAAVRSGTEMLVQRPELSIWSLLFVALGEGLAIYGLIVAILLVSVK